MEILLLRGIIMAKNKLEVKLKEAEGLAIDFETADRITVLSLLHTVGVIKDQNKIIRKNKKPLEIDVLNLQENEELLAHINAVLEYFGGDFYDI